MDLSSGLSFKNTSGEDVPPGAAMEIKDVLFEENEIVLEIKKPTTSGISKNIIVFNGAFQVPNNGGGRARASQILVAGVTGSPSLGDTIGPVDGQWLMSSSGSGYKYLKSATATMDNGAVVLALGGGGSSEEYVYEITGSFVAGTPSTAKVTIYSKSDESTVIATNADWIGNLAMFDDHVVGTKGICTKAGSVYVAQNAPCDTTGAPATVTVHIGASPPASTSALWIDTSGL